MSEFFLQMFGKFKQRLFRKVSEKDHTVPDIFIHFFEKFLLKWTGKFWDKLLLFFNIRISLNNCRLFDVIGQLILNFRVNGGFLRDLVKNFEIAVLLKVISANFGNNLTDSVDIVSKDDTTHGFDKDHTECFILVAGDNISESHCEHNSCSPIVSPYVLFVPLWFTKALYGQPIYFLVEPSHRNQNYSQAMRNHKVKEENLNQVPYFLSIFVFNQHQFDMAQDHKQSLYFHDDQ